MCSVWCLLESKIHAKKNELTCFKRANQTKQIHHFGQCVHVKNELNGISMANEIYSIHIIHNLMSAPFNSNCWRSVYCSKDADSYQPNGIVAHVRQNTFNLLVFDDKNTKSSHDILSFYLHLIQ